MNGRDHDELLSAYHDGELAGEERASVERLIGDDLPAREVLDDIADMSRLLGALPRPAAPPEMHAAVMRQVRQAAPTRAAQSRPVARPRRYWVWSAATVACLLLVVFIVQQNLNSPSATGVAHNERDAATPAAIAEPMSPPATTVSPRDERPMPMGRDTAPDALLPPAAAPSNAAANELSADLKALEAAVASGQRPQIGDLLKSIVHEGDQVQIVQYTVVDVVEAFGEAQVLLEQNGIETITGDQQAAQRSPGPSEKFYAILVDAPDDKVGSTLAALRGAEFVHEVAVTNVDELSSFPLPSPKPGEPGTDDATGLEPARAPKAGERGTPAPPPPAPAAVSEVTAPPAEEGVAVPIPLPFSEKDMQDVLAADATESVRRDPGPPSRAQAERPPGEGGATRPAADRAASAPRKRILIVLVPERPRP
jgi:anti-sigma factor RsiW